jgi:hypothetical protein
VSSRKPVIEIHPHARERSPERGIGEQEIVATVLTGESFPAKFGRMGFRKIFDYNANWRGRWYANKEVEAIAVETSDGWLVLTVIARYF